MRQHTLTSEVPATAEYVLRLDVPVNEACKHNRKQQVYIQELKAELNALRQNMDLMVQESLVISVKSNSLEKQYSIEEQKQEVSIQELKELNEWSENKHLKDFML